jgi:hypothetical protein
VIGLPHCDVNITTACNAACVGCSHLAPVIKPQRMMPTQLEQDLMVTRQFLRFTQLCAVGGEPTIHPLVSAMLQIMRQARISDEVMIITNGRRLKTLPPSFWEALEPADGLPGGALRLSVYPGLDPSIPEFAASKCEEHKIRFESHEYREFYSQFKRVPDDGAKSFADCVWKNDCYTVHNGKLYRCPQSTFFHNIFPKLKEGEDGYDLYTASEESIRAFLDSTVPLKACSVCSGGSTHAFPWEETRDAKAWIKKATVND